MKNKKIKVLALMLTLVAMFALVGCGNDSSPEDYNDSPSLSLDDGYATLDEFFDDSDISLDSLEEQAGEGMEITVEGNTLVYTYSYTETFDSTMVGYIADEIEKQMGEFEGSLVSVANEISNMSGIENIEIKVVFLNGDGTEIYSTIIDNE